MTLFTATVNKKKAFSLMELVIVIVLIGMVTSIMIPNLLKTTSKNSAVKLIDLKKYLLSKYSFRDTLSLTCVDEDLMCYIFVDGLRKESAIENLFMQEPRVYESSDSYSRIDLGRVYVNEFDERDVIFNLSIDNDFKSNEFLLEYDDKIYHYSSIKEKANIYDNIGEYKDFVDYKQSESKDGF